MSNKKYKLANNDYWATDGVYDLGQSKTQRQINSDLNGAILSRYSKGKIAIVGDSISAYTGYIPSGYTSIYPNDVYDITDVSQMWWAKLIANSGMQLDVNASQTASCVTNVRSQYPMMWESCQLLQNPDIIFMARGLNDYYESAPLGDFTFSTGWTSQNEAQFRPAYIKAIQRTQYLYPNAKIVLLIIGHRMSDDYANSIIHIADYYGLDCIDCRDYTPHSATDDHPDSDGMRDIASLVAVPSATNLPCYKGEIITPSTDASNAYWQKRVVKIGYIGAITLATNTKQWDSAGWKDIGEVPWNLASTMSGLYLNTYGLASVSDDGSTWTDNVVVRVRITNANILQVQLQKAHLKNLIINSTWIL